MNFNEREFGYIWWCRVLNHSYWYLRQEKNHQHYLTLGTKRYVHWWGVICYQVLAILWYVTTWPVHKAGRRDWLLSWWSSILILNIQLPWFSSYNPASAAVPATCLLHPYLFPMVLSVRRSVSIPLHYSCNSGRHGISQRHWQFPEKNPDSICSIHPCI